jgi:hypothetical protein
MGQVCGLYQVDQSTIAVKEKFGKFSTVMGPGCHCVPWCCGVNIAGVLSLRVQQLDVRCETKTKVQFPSTSCTAVCMTETLHVRLYLTLVIFCGRSVLVFEFCDVTTVAITHKRKEPNLATSQRGQ